MMFRSLAAMAVLFVFGSVSAQMPAPAHGNLQRGDRYLYCHMNDAGPAWTAYALSRDGLHYHEKAVIAVVKLF